MRLVLGPNEISQEGLGFIAHIFYSLGLLYVGIIIGIIIAVLFLLIVGVFFKKKLKSFCVHLLVFLIITAGVIGFHYLLEKVIDII